MNALFLPPPWINLLRTKEKFSPLYSKSNRFNEDVLGILHYNIIALNRRNSPAINVEIEKRDDKLTHTLKGRLSGTQTDIKKGGKGFSKEKGEGKEKSDNITRNVVASKAVASKKNSVSSKRSSPNSRKVSNPQHRKHRRRQSQLQEFLGNVNNRHRTLLRHSEEIALVAKVQKGIRLQRLLDQLQSRRHKSNSGGDQDDIATVARVLRLDEASVREQLRESSRAKDELVARNLGLVRKIASAYYDRSEWAGGLALDDLIQEGCVGLVRAAEKFEVERGFRFSTYATFWVKAAVLRTLGSQTRLIKLPQTVSEEFWRIRKAYQELISNGRNPSEESIASALGITVPKLKFVLEVANRQPISLDVRLSSRSEEDRALVDIVPAAEDSEVELVESMQRKEVDKALKECLTPRERAIIRLRFGLEDGHQRTLREIGTLTNYSKERVRQVIFSALNKLRKREVQDVLRDFLD